MPATIGVVTNPNSGKNRRNPGRLGELERAVGRHGIVRQTQSLDELPKVVGELLDAGCKYWVCDGGDGTLHWLISVAHEIARQRGPGTVLPTVVPANGGSIDFVAHKAGIRGQAPDVVRTLVEYLDRDEKPTVVQLDTLRLRGEGTQDGSFDRVGFAAAIGGVAQRFFDKLYERRPVRAWSICSVLAKSAAGAVAGSTPRPLDRFVLPDLQKYADDIFEPTKARVDVDGSTLEFETFSSLQVGSIDISLGGVVRTFRHAKTAGTLHAQAISASRLGIVANLPSVVMGTRIWGRDVYDGPARTLRASALEGSTLDPVIDGEIFRGLTSIEVSRGPSLEVASVCAN